MANIAKPVAHMSWYVRRRSTYWRSTTRANAAATSAVIAGSKVTSECWVAAPARRPQGGRKHGEARGHSGTNDEGQHRALSRRGRAGAAHEHEKERGPDRTDEERADAIHPAADRAGERRTGEERRRQGHRDEPDPVGGAQALGERRGDEGSNARLKRRRGTNVDLSGGGVAQGRRPGPSPAGV